MGCPIHFAEADLVVGPPADCSARVVPIPVRQLVNGYLVSCWQLGPEEIAEVVRTGKIWLKAQAKHNHPAVEVAGIKGHVVPA